MHFRALGAGSIRDLKCWALELVSTESVMRLITIESIAGFAETRNHSCGTHRRPSVWFAANHFRLATAAHG